MCAIDRVREVGVKRRRAMRSDGGAVARACEVG
jgi:hypothetical protein